MQAVTIQTNNTNRSEEVGLATTNNEVEAAEENEKLERRLTLKH